MRDVFRHSPARALTPKEHATVAEWLAAAGDIASAYVSDRRTDDPAMYRCIVVITKFDDGPSRLVHAPIDEAVWVVFKVGKESKVEKFLTLRTALNSIRPVLVREDA